MLEKSGSFQAGYLHLETAYPCSFRGDLSWRFYGWSQTMQCAALPQQPRETGMEESHQDNEAYQAQL